MRHLACLMRISECRCQLVLKQHIMAGMAVEDANEEMHKCCL
ncbi:hypothetical protein EJP617_33820 [Erwinia sp. Ejp617]|nr:hypothetical protein [Erwinia sp. Ejp617]ADP13063.1 hypothetical protein EJP617_33820 [Erwinia sp. Ejp617]